MRCGAPAGTAADGAELIGELDAAALELIELPDGAAELLGLLGLLDTATAVVVLTTLAEATAALLGAAASLLLHALNAAHSAIKTAVARVLADMVLPLVFSREVDPRPRRRSRDVAHSSGLVITPTH